MVAGGMDTSPPSLDNEGKMILDATGRGGKSWRPGLCKACAGIAQSCEGFRHDGTPKCFWGLSLAIFGPLKVKCSSGRGAQRHPGSRTGQVP